MLDRRRFIKSAGAGLVVSLAGCGGGGSSSGSGNTGNTNSTGPDAGSNTNTGPENGNNSLTRWYMPGEAVPHQCTWMAFGSNFSVWNNQVGAVQDEIALLARTLAEFEPVRMLVRSPDLSVAREKCGSEVEMVVAELDDVWIRDTGPVFVQSELGRAAAVDFNFNGWGNKRAHVGDAGVFDAVAQAAGVTRLSSTLVMEGGAIEVDGEGSAIATESAVLNPNRNPGVSKAMVERELSQWLGIDKVIWLPGVSGHDLRDGHTSFYARFVKPGAVVVGLEANRNHYNYTISRRHLEILQNATDARGRSLDVVPLNGPAAPRANLAGSELAAGYVNFYVANDVVLAPEFGDAQADARARLSLQELFPERNVRLVPIDTLAAAGGGIHCVTQQEPLA